MVNKYWLLFLTIIGLSTSSAMAGTSKPNITPASEKRLSTGELQSMMKRIKVIYNLDKSKLGKSDKQILRNEVLGIKEKLNSPGGVYISAVPLLSSSFSSYC